jgi:hypothetical protein
MLVEETFAPPLFFKRAQTVLQTSLVFGGQWASEDFSRNLFPFFGTSHKSGRGEVFQFGNGTFSSSHVTFFPFFFWIKFYSFSLTCACARTLSVILSLPLQISALKQIVKLILSEILR